MKNTRVAIFGGSFNPPTLAHMEIVNQLLIEDMADVILLVPCGNRKDKDNFQNGVHRLSMLELSFSEYFGHKPKVIDSKNGIPHINNLSKSSKSLYHSQKVFIDCYEINNFIEMVPTTDLLKNYQKNHISMEFTFVIGSDLLSSIKHWEDYHTFLKFQKYIVFKRKGYQNEDGVSELAHSRIHKIKYEMVSSTKVRNILVTHSNNQRKLRDSLNSLIGKSTMDYILVNKIYL